MCLYFATRALDRTGKGRARWAARWKPALNAFAITFEDRSPRVRIKPVCQNRIHRYPDSPSQTGDSDALTLPLT